MKLTIDLSPLEESNIRGWVNKGKAEPAFAANPYRLVLEERTRARFDQIAAQFEATPAPSPTPPPAEGPLARLDAAPSNWAKYCREFFTNEEIAALIARTGKESLVHEISAFYDVGGIGNVRGFRDGNNYRFFKGEVLTPDVGGAADAHIKAIADAQGKTVPRL